MEKTFCTNCGEKEINGEVTMYSSKTGKPVVWKTTCPNADSNNPELLCKHYGHPREMTPIMRWPWSKDYIICERCHKKLYISSGSPILG